jgi:hypothetical protein
MVELLSTRYSIVVFSAYFDAFHHAKESPLLCLVGRPRGSPVDDEVE